MLPLLRYLRCKTHVSGSVRNVEYGRAASWTPKELGVPEKQASHSEHSLSIHPV